jgi:hypothetical protein
MYGIIQFHSDLTYHHDSAYYRYHFNALSASAFFGIKDFVIQAIESGLSSVNSQFQALELSIEETLQYINATGTFAKRFKEFKDIVELLAENLKKELHNGADANYCW